MLQLDEVKKIIEQMELRPGRSYRVTSIIRPAKVIDDLERELIHRGHSPKVSEQFTHKGKEVKKLDLPQHALSENVLLAGIEINGVRISYEELEKFKAAGILDKSMLRRIIIRMEYRKTIKENPGMKKSQIRLLLAERHCIDRKTIEQIIYRKNPQRKEYE